MPGYVNEWISDFYLAINDGVKARHEITLRNLFRFHPTSPMYSIRQL